jgi:uncharacterized protein (TIGR02171 family)
MSCEHVDRVEAPPVVSAQHLGMARMHSRGMAVRLGSRDEYARIDEFPPMTVSFTYDYWIDKNEISVGQYLEIAGRLPGEYHGRVGEQTFPVVHVTWYDAALFCNARSKLVGLDTVYAFSGIDSTADGTVFRLRNLEVRLERAGYRLPTEAEWAYAAAAGSDTTFAWGADSVPAGDFAWYAANASGAPEPGQTRRPNRFGLYDMAGNVMEWVTDVKGPYDDTALVDFAGAFGEDTDERAVKGGSFTHGVEYLRPSARSETYETLASSRTRYIGFRCALGAIGTPSYTNPANASGSSAGIGYNHTTVPATPTPRARLAFVKRDGAARTLCTIDFAQIVPALIEYRDQQNVYLPTISPDGNWVSYCTGGEGMYDNSSVYLRPFGDTAAVAVKLGDEPAFVPRWWVDPAGGDTCIVYTNATVLNDAPSWRAGRTMRVRVRAGAFAGTPEVVDDQGSYHGGLSADSRYLATGLPLLYMKDRVSGERRTLFTGPQNGKPAGDTSQVCNVSISPSAVYPDEILMIDFGSLGRVSTVTGTAYGVHEYLFRVNYDNVVTGAWRFPMGEGSWDHPEWSNVYECAVAGSQDSRGQHPRIYAVNLRSSALMPLAWTNRHDLWHPYLWVDPRVSAVEQRYDIDSVGRYNEPRSLENTQSGLAGKMGRFWRRGRDVELMFIGSSRMEGGIAPAEFSGYSAFNLSTPGMRLPMVERLLYDYVLRHCPQLKLVGINLQPGWMADTMGAERWTQATGQTVGYQYDRNHGFWRDSVTDELVYLISKAPNGLDDADDDDQGFVRRTCNGWGFHAFAGSTEWDTTDTNYAKHLGMLRRMADTLAARGVHLLVIAFPQSWAYRTFAYDGVRMYGRYGPTLTTAEQMWAQLRRMEQESPLFHFYDAHLFGWHDYQPLECYDVDHLCEPGAMKLTERVDSLVHTILP